MVWMKGMVNRMVRCIVYLQDFMLQGFEIPFYMGLILLIGTIFIASQLQLVLHELGHYVFGKITGFQLVSFRVLSFVLIKAAGKWRIKRYSFPGTSGQCILAPAFPKKEKKPYVLITLGGVLMNIISSAFFLLMILLFQLPYFLELLFLLSIYMGVLYAIFNGIPFKHSSINNDGMNFVGLMKDKQAVISKYINMHVFQQIAHGKTYKDIPLALLKVPQGANLSNGHNAYLKLTECYYYMDMKNWDKAWECLCEFDLQDKQMSKMTETMICIEKLYLLLVMQEESPQINELYQKHHKLLKKGKRDFHCLRVLLAYEYKVIKKDRAYISKRANRLMRNYPYLGEARFCKNQIDSILR